MRGEVQTLIPAMSEDERQRWDAGRHDWEEGHWQDHCGDPDCEHCTGFIERDPIVAAARAKLAKALRL